MKLPKRRRRVVAIEAPRRVRRTGHDRGSISGGTRGNNGDGEYYLALSTHHTLINNIKVLFAPSK